MRVTNTLKYTLAERDIYGSKRIGADFTPVQLISALPVSMIDTFGRYLGNKQYEMDNHLGNVLTTISDRKIPISYDTTTGSNIDHYEVDVLSSQDYYPFGWEEPHRNFTTTKYRFGFNAQEKDDDIYGAGNSYTAKFWEYDPRLSRRWNRDPAAKCWGSPYISFSDNPVWKIDPNGDDDYFNAQGQLAFQTSTGSKIYVQTANGNYQSFSQLPVDYGSIQTISNIATHYGQKVGIKTGVDLGYDGLNKDALAYTDEVNSIYLQNSGGHVNTASDDYNNLQSTLYHEKVHQERGQGGKNISNLDHLDVYLTQMGDKTFKSTTSDYKDGIIAQVGQMIADEAQTMGGTKEGDDFVEKTNKVIEKFGYSISVGDYSQNPTKTKYGAVVTKTEGKNVTEFKIQYGKNNSEDKQ